MSELILAIDAGTTNLRVCLFAPNGDLLGQAGSAVTSHAPAPGRVEQDADAIWRALRRVMDQVLAEAGRTAADLGAIGITSQRTSAVLWDRATGQPLTPLVVWSDLRGAGRAAELAALGHVLAPQQAAAKLESMASGLEPQALANAAFGNIDAFLIWKLTGGASHITDRSQAWPTGYLSLSGFVWNEDLLALQGLAPSLLPSLCDSWGRLGVTARDVLGVEVAICADIADQQSALIGQGCETAGDCKVTYGTSATLDVSTGGAFLYPGPTLPPFVLSSVGGETRFCLEGMVYTAGAALDWLRHHFALGDFARFEALAASASGCEGVHILPAFQGLGAPHGDPNKRGLIGGLGLGAGSAQIALAAMEGVAFRVVEIFQAIYGATDLPVPEVVRVDGGLTGNATLMQVQADLLGRPVQRHAHGEATAAGAAICAGRGAGLITAGEASGFIRHDRTFEPRISAAEAGDRLAIWKSQVYPA